MPATTSPRDLGDGFVVFHLQLCLNSVCSLNRAWLLFLTWSTEQRPELGLQGAALAYGSCGGVSTNWSVETEFEAWFHPFPAFPCSS